VAIKPDTTTIPSSPDADVLVLPGGAKGAATFSSNAKVQSLIRAYRDTGKYVAFICAATTALAASVLSAGKTEGLESAKKVRVTSHPSVKDEVVQAGWEYAPDAENVVVDGKVITSRGPGTALIFSYAIIEQVISKTKMEEVRGPMVYQGP
jgi:protein DJ-1